MRQAIAPPIPPAVVVTGAAVRVDRVDAGLLSGYPHIAACPACRAYARDALPGLRPDTIQAAALAHHDSGHRDDPLLTASQHFAVHDPAD